MEPEKKLNTLAGFSLKRFCLRALFLIFGLCVVTFALASPLGTYADVVLLRTLFAMRGKITPSDKVVIVALDDLSFEALDAWDNGREYLIRTVNKINDSAPALLILDLYFDKKEVDDQTRQLADAIKKGPTTIMRRHDEAARRRLYQRYGAEKPAEEVALENNPLLKEAALMELSPFLQSQLGLTFQPGVIDRENFSITVPIAPGLRAIGMADLKMPGPLDYINFYGPPNTIPYVSMHDVLTRDIDFKDKIVLLGFKSFGTEGRVPGEEDIFQTSGSFSSDYFGVEVLATITSNLLDKNSIKGFSSDFKYGVLPFFIVFPMLFLSQMKPSKSLAFLTAMLFTWFVITLASFFWGNTLFPGFFVLLFISPLYCAGIWFFYGNRIAKENERLRGGG